jgi:hypothetical protein
MAKQISIEARWDGEANVWIATSRDVPGLVVEAESWPTMIEEVRLAGTDGTGRTRQGEPGADIQGRTAS